MKKIISTTKEHVKIRIFPFIGITALAIASFALMFWLVGMIPEEQEYHTGNGEFITTYAYHVCGKEKLTIYTTTGVYDINGVMLINWTNPVTEETVQEIIRRTQMSIWQEDWSPFCNITRVPPTPIYFPFEGELDVPFEQYRLRNNYTVIINLFTKNENVSHIRIWNGTLSQEQISLFFTNTSNVLME